MGYRNPTNTELWAVENSAQHKTVALCSGYGFVRWMRATATTLRSYLRETSFSAHLVPQLDDALALASSRAKHSRSAERALLVLQAEATHLAEIHAQSKAWHPVVVEVLARIDDAIALEATANNIRLEQAHLGLTLLRACSAALKALPDPAPWREAITAFVPSLFALVHGSLAQLHTAAPPPAHPSTAAIKEQEAVQAQLSSLGCGDVLRSLRRMSVGGLVAATDSTFRELAPTPASVDEALLLSSTRVACVNPAGDSLPEAILGLVARSCRRRWDECCVALSGGGTEEEVVAKADVAALLDVMRWWRPLVLGMPPQPRWHRDVSGKHTGTGAAAAIDEAAAIHVQARWRARKGRAAASSAALARAEHEGATALGDEAGELRARVLQVRAAMMAERSAAASAAALTNALEPLHVIDELLGLERRLALQLSTLTLSMCAPLPPAPRGPPSEISASEISASPHRRPVSVPPAVGSPRPAYRSPARSPFKPPPVSPALAASPSQPLLHLPPALVPTSPPPAPPPQAFAAVDAAAAAENGFGSVGPQQPATDFAAAERLSTSRAAAAWDSWLDEEARQMAGRRETVSTMETAAVAEAAAADVVDRPPRAQMSDGQMAAAAASEQEAATGDALPLRSRRPQSPARYRAPIGGSIGASPTPTSPLSPRPSAPASANGRTHAVWSASRQANLTLSRTIVAGTRLASTEDGRAAAPPPRDVRVSLGDGGEIGGEMAAMATAPSAAAEHVRAWWSSQFGPSSAEAVPFERLRLAVEPEMGKLTSVDIQLLRLELSDDKGRLTMVALTRLLAGAIDGSEGHSTVPLALRALLQNARAQLDKQVEVRMRQAAASRMSRGPVVTPR